MSFVLQALLLGGCMVSAANAQEKLNRVEQHGSMHETIGEQHHHGRVKLEALLQRPHFFGVGALERLEGEISIFDSKAVVTGVGSDGKPVVLNDRAASLQATLFVGGQVPEWREVFLSDAVDVAKFDQTIAEKAAELGIDTSKPFLFAIEGEFQKVWLHVINGACPLHSRLRKKTIAADQKPIEQDLEQVSGRLIGVHAKDAVGKLTHPATSVHAHLIFTNDKGELLTGHLEQVGLQKNARLLLPVQSSGGEASK